MNKLLLLCMLLAIPLIGKDKKILFTELNDPQFREFSTQYNQKFRAIWAADSGVEIISHDVVEKIQYRNHGGTVPLDSSTVAYLKRYGHDSVFAVVPSLEAFSIIAKRGKGFPGIILGKGEGSLVVRYRFVDLTSGKTLYTGAAESDTSISLGTTLLRPVYKSVNISAIERDQIVTSLIDHNIRESYRLLNIYKDDLERDSSSTDSTNTKKK